MLDKLQEYITEDNLRLLAAGAAATALAAAGLQRLRAGAGHLIGWASVVLGFFITGWDHWPDAPARRLLPGLLIVALSVVGMERLRGDGVRVGTRTWALLAVCGAVWLAVPENRPIVPVAGALLAYRWVGPSDSAAWADAGFAAGIGWAVLHGAHVRDFALVGGLLTLAPLAAASLPRPRRTSVRLPADPWLVPGTALLGFASARWVGVAPDATWIRVAVLSAASLALAWTVRRPGEPCPRWPVTALRWPPWRQPPPRTASGPRP